MIALDKDMGTSMEEGLWQNNSAKVETLVNLLILAFICCFQFPAVISWQSGLGGTRINERLSLKRGFSVKACEN